jgi:hypothetical protein
MKKRLERIDAELVQAESEYWGAVHVVWLVGARLQGTVNGTTPDKIRAKIGKLQDDMNTAIVEMLNAADYANKLRAAYEQELAKEAAA